MTSSGGSGRSGDIIRWALVGRGPRQCPHGTGQRKEITASFPLLLAGADPGFRRGGGFVHSEGGVSYRNFRSGSKLLQGPGQINKQTKIADSRRGGGVPMTPQKNLYPRMPRYMSYIVLNILWSRLDPSPPVVYSYIHIAIGCTFGPFF